MAKRAKENDTAPVIKRRRVKWFPSGKYGKYLAVVQSLLTAAFLVGTYNLFLLPDFAGSGNVTLLLELEDLLVIWAAFVVVLLIRIGGT